jgi:hypothetical protein
MTARWAEALDTQLDAWRWFREGQGQRELRGFAESFIAKVIDPKQEGLSPEEMQNVAPVVGSYAQQVDNIPTMLWRADPIYVDPEMMPLIEMATDTWQAEPFLETDMLIPDGFLLLPRSIHVRDIHGKRMGIRAFLWSRATVTARDGSNDRPGFGLALFSDQREPDDYPLPAYPRGTNLALMHIIPWAFGESATPLMKEFGSFTGTETLQCILRLMAQTIAVRTEGHAPRDTRKRLARADFPAKRITIVTLRRPEAERDHGAHSDVHWTRRWIVDGHWRQQWYPSLGMHRQIWISPYVKGPTDLPLVVPKAHVYQFVR